MAMQKIDRVTPKPGGKVGDDLDTITIKINANVDDAQAQLDSKAATTALTAETTARQQALAAETQARNTAIGNETTARQQALALKANASGGTFTGPVAVAIAPGSADAGRALGIAEAGATGDVRRLDISLLTGSGTSAREIVFRAILTAKYTFDVATAAFTGGVTTVGGVAAGGSVISAAGGITSNGSNGGLTFQDRADFSRSWNFYSTGAIARLWLTGFGDRMTCNSAGAVTATSFTPTSSADVKDYIEGYAGDADAELDRLVVISYRYRPEFCDYGDKSFVGFLAENVNSVAPSATGGDEDTIVQIEVPVTDAAGVTTGYEFKEVDHHVPMNIDPVQILALNTRAHQQKTRLIKQLQTRVDGLETALASVLARLAALET